MSDGYPQFARTLIKIWAIPEELWMTKMEHAHEDRVVVEAGTVGELLGECSNSWGTPIACIRFPGELIALLGKSAWVAEITKDA